MLKSILSIFKNKEEKSVQTQEPLLFLRELNKTYKDIGYSVSSESNKNRFRIENLMDDIAKGCEYIDDLDFQCLMKPVYKYLNSNIPYETFLKIRSQYTHLEELFNRHVIHE